MMRRWLLIALCLLPVQAWGHATFTNEPSGANVVLDCPFTQALCTGMYNAYGTLPFAQPGGSGTTVSPPWALHENLAVNTQFGNGQWGILFNQGMQEIFIGAIWQVNSDYVGYSNNTNKQIFIKNPAVDNNFIVWQGLPGATKTLKFYLQASYDNCHISSHNAYPGPTGCWNDPNPATRDGTGWFNPNINSAIANVAGGSGWHKLEVYIKVSSGFASKDGIIRFWIDGFKSSEFTNANITPGGVTDVTINAAWDGSGSCSTRDCSKSWSKYIDHLYISIPNCPGGCPGGGTDPLPPPPPPPPDPLPPPENTYIYQSQFSGTQGSGQWSYRDTAGNLLTYNSSNQLWSGSQSFLTMWQNGFHPGTTNGAVARWTAPANGTAHITGAAQKADLACGDGSTFRVLYGASILFSQPMSYNDGTAYPYDLTQSMTTGQTLDFVVYPESNNNCDSTYLDPTIEWTPSVGAAPTISSFTPTSGAAGTSVTITGTNFVPSISGNQVSFSGIGATVTSATATQIVAVVPTNAVTGTIKVITAQGSGTSGSNFTVPLTGTVGTVNDLAASATGTTSASVRFTAITDGTGAPAKYDIRIAQGTISWGTASGVAAGTCTSPYNPGLANQQVTCTVTGLTTGTLYQLQLVGYRGTIGVDAVYGNLSNIATVTTQGTVLDVPVICQVTDDLLLVADGCPKTERLEQVSLLHD